MEGLKSHHVIMDELTESTEEARKAGVARMREQFEAIRVGHAMRLREIEADLWT